MERKAQKELGKDFIHARFRLLEYFVKEKDVLFFIRFNQSRNPPKKKHDETVL